MKKRIFKTFIILFLITFSSCQSIQQISIDYMLPAKVSFPNTLRNVAIVDNTNATSQGNILFNREKEEQKNLKQNVYSKETIYFNGNAKTSAEALAKEIADRNYFEKVIICDSALRTGDYKITRNKLSKEEVNKLISDLGVDFLISLDNVSIKAKKIIRYEPYEQCFKGTIDATVQPTISIYLPQREKPMLTISPQDSIFWEEYAPTILMTNNALIQDTAMVTQASNFGGTIPVNYIIPHWKTANRYIYSNGSINMRNAAIYAREEKWDYAFKLWNESWKSARKNKEKMYLSNNIAVYYEMQDSIEIAIKWEKEAEKYAKATYHIKEKIKAGEYIDNNTNYYKINAYLKDLEERFNDLPSLYIQMQRIQ
ncbi:MAG: DUF6340 family protein [Bacteroidaceae bacterium]